jgi:DNA-binding MarR family transcriptional regulator
MTTPARQSRRSATVRAVRIDAETAVELDEALQFMRTLWETVHSLQKTSKRMSRTMGITGPQRLVIRAVGLAPGLSAGAIAKLLHIHPSTLTGVLQRLERQRLVRRVRAAGDARRACLSLTDRGQRVNGAGEGTVESAVRHVLALVPVGDQRTARHVLNLLAAALDSDGASRRPKSSRRRGEAGGTRR